MKNSIRLKILFVLAFVFTLMASVGIISAIDVKAAPQTFAMHPGASVRLGNENDTQTGIRFIATIDSEEYNQLLSDYENVQFGMRIARCETVEELMLFPDESSMKPVETVVENAEEGIHVISVAIHNIKAENYNTYFTALGYVEVTDAQGEKEVFYADYVAGENSRTPFQVVATHKLQYGMLEDLNMDYANAILDNVLAQGGMIAQKAEYVLALNSSVAPVIEVAGVPVDADLSVANTAVAKIENGQLVAVGAGSTTLTAVVSGAEKILNISIPVTVENSTLALTYANGTVEWAGVATAVVIDGNEVAVSETENAFDVAAYLKKNGYEEKSYAVAVKNGEVVSESVTIEMKNVDNADELLAISEGSANTYYVVTDNISLAGKEVSTFGTSRAFIESLTGVLDVNGYAISAISYDEPDNTLRYRGLIATVEQTGVVKNGYFTGASTPYFDHRAFLIGQLDGTIEDCYVDVKKFSLTTGNNYYATCGVVYECYGTVKNLIVNLNKCNAGLTVFAYANAKTNTENVIVVSDNEKTNGMHIYRLAGGNSHKYLAFDKNNTYLYKGMSALFSRSGKILKYDGANFVFASTVNVPYLNFAPVFDFDEQAGKIYMVNDKYGKMDFAVSINIAQDELDVVKDKYSPQISATLSGIYGSDALTYKSSNTAIATVDANGVVSYAGNGTATITVTHTESGATATVSVKTYDTYIGITDVASFITIEGSTQYTYAELLSDISITTNDLSRYAEREAFIILQQTTANNTSFSLIYEFGGTLNGNGKKVIVDVSFETVTSTKRHSAIFSKITETAVIKNTVFDIDVQAYLDHGSAFAFFADGVIQDCYFDIYVTARESGSGNFLATHYFIQYAQCDINNCIIKAHGQSGGAGGKRNLNLYRAMPSKFNINDTMFVVEYLIDSYDKTNKATLANVSNYSSFANLLVGTGYTLTYDTALTRTAITNSPQYNLFGPVWAFGADGIKLCGTAIYTPAN